MKPTKEQLVVLLRSKYSDLIAKQEKAQYIKDPLQLDKEITKILSEKNKITIELMNLKEKL